MGQSTEIIERIPGTLPDLNMDLSTMLRRFFLPTIASLVFAVPVLAQVTADRVLYRDRTQDGKVVTVEGEAKESASGVQVIGADKKVKAISANDMVRVDYGTVPGVERTGQLSAITLETSGDPVKTAGEYRKLMAFPGATGNPKAKRYLEFRELAWSARIADAKAGDEFKLEGKKVADRLVVYSKANAASWEAWTTARLAARFFCELEDLTAASDAIAILSRNAALSPELRHEAKLLEVGYLFRANKRLDAEGILKELAADKAFPATGPLRERWAIFDEVVKAPLPPQRKDTDPPAAPEELDARHAKVKEAAAKIEALIAKAKDPAARGAGYGALGEVFIRHGLWRDAMWAYLWVDVVYNQDRDEQVKAVHRLVQIFTVLKDKDKAGEGEKDRADTYRDRLPKIRG